MLSFLESRDLHMAARCGRRAERVGAREQGAREKPPITGLFQDFVPSFRTQLMIRHTVHQTFSSKATLKSVRVFIQHVRQLDYHHSHFALSIFSPLQAARLLQVADLMENQKVR